MSPARRRVPLALAPLPRLPKLPYRSGVVFAILAVFLLAGCPASLDGVTADEPEAWVRIGTSAVAVEVADTPEKQQRGLGYRDSLAWDTGMYFPYPRAVMPSFWMKGMRFSIDIVWIRDGRIVDVHDSVPFEPGGNGPTVRPSEAADAVLEVPAGYSRASGWRIGDRVRFERTATSS